MIEGVDLLTRDRLVKSQATRRNRLCAQSRGCGLLRTYRSMPS